jgi:hypothetical protein
MRCGTSASWSGAVTGSAVDYNGCDEPLLRQPWAGRPLGLRHGLGRFVEDLVAVTGHTSSRTTRRYYDEALAPRRLVPPFELHHPDDPPA